MPEMKKQDQSLASTQADTTTLLALRKRVPGWEGSCHSNLKGSSTHRRHSCVCMKGHFNLRHILSNKVLLEDNQLLRREKLKVHITQENTDPEVHQSLGIVTILIFILQKFKACSPHSILKTLVN